jgi:predicted O-methyltransferase YrrM
MVQPVPALELSLFRPSEEVSSALRESLSRLVDPESAEYFARIRQISMLDLEALQLLAVFGASSRDGVLEIGPYIGGSTVSIATGCGSGRPFVTIEVGGSYLDQPFLPSANIIADLRRNLARFGFDDMVSVVQGWSHDPESRRAVAARLGRRKIGLLSVDADGQIEATLAYYSRLLHDDCLLVIDDYLAPGARAKEELVKPYVDEAVREGYLREFGVFGSGTWFGQVNGAVARAHFATAKKRFLHDAGFCYQVFFSCTDPPDDLYHLDRSRIRVFERGVPLGPAHSLHKAIRRFGHGRYSHWSASADAERDGLFPTCLYFSTSDNSNPNTNGRRYAVEVGGTLIDLGDL